MAFGGWSDAALEFYEGLTADNSKTFWTTNKPVYEEQVLTPMLALLAELEPEFGAGRLFRPYRDVRFSADKTPYKTHIGATLAKGGYVQLSGDGLAAGGGLWMMTPGQLANFRRAVADDSSGAPLAKLVADLRRGGIEVMAHDSLKSAPRGYPAEHPRIELLRQKGLAAWRQWPPGPWLAKASAKSRVVELLRAAAPLSLWLDEHVGR